MLLRMSNALAAAAMVGQCIAFAGHAEASPKPSTREMTVRVARSTVPGCEPNCAEWIVADGEITARTPGLFRKAFKLAGKDNLPVVLNSPGGQVEPAIEIGRMLRSRGAETMVARTIFDGCSPLTDIKCQPNSPHVQRFTAYGTVLPGLCASACVFIFAGGSKRMAPEFSLGTHQIVSHPSLRKVWYRETYRLIHGKKKVIARKIVKEKTVALKPTVKLSKSYRNKFTRYFAEMGIGEGFYPLFDKAPPEKIHLLDKEEMQSTEIVTSELPNQPVFGRPRCAEPHADNGCVKLH